MNCAGCGNELKDVFEDKPQNHQYEDAMDLTLSPGWGERFDGLNDVRFFLCNICSTQIFTLLPMLREYIEERLYVSQGQHEPG